MQCGALVPNIGVSTTYQPPLTQTLIPADHLGLPTISKLNLPAIEIAHMRYHTITCVRKPPPPGFTLGNQSSAASLA